MQVQSGEVQGRPVLYVECPHCPTRFMARNPNPRRAKCQEEFVRAGLVAHFAVHLLPPRPGTEACMPRRARAPRPQ